MRSLYESRLKTWADGQGLPVVWENVAASELEPTYLRAFLLPALTDTAFMAGSHRSYIGVFQISIVTPHGGGAGIAEGIASELDALFPAHLRLSSGSLAVFITTPLAAAVPIVEPDCFVLPVSFNYRADTV